MLSLGRDVSEIWDMQQPEYVVCWHPQATAVLTSQSSPYKPERLCVG